MIPPILAVVGAAVVAGVVYLLRNQTEKTEKTDVSKGNPPVREDSGKNDKGSRGAGPGGSFDININVGERKQSKVVVPNNKEKEKEKTKE